MPKKRSTPAPRNTQGNGQLAPTHLLLRVLLQRQHGGQQAGQHICEQGVTEQHHPKAVLCSGGNGHAGQCAQAKAEPVVCACACTCACTCPRLRACMHLTSKAWLAAVQRPGVAAIYSGKLACLDPEFPHKLPWHLHFCTHQARVVC